jgi:hypothetical protein
VPVTSTQIESFVTLVVASGVVIVLVLVGGPALARLLFRFRLEAVHDAAVDAVLERRLRPERPVTIFTEDVDRAAEHPHWVTLARGGAMLRALKDLGVEDPTKLIPQLSYSELEPSERKIMHELEQRTFSAFRSYLIWGSPLGWALAPLVFLIHFHPGRKFTKTDQAVPAVARGAMCGDTGVYRKATRWASGSGSYASR